MLGSGWEEEEGEGGGGRGREDILLGRREKEECGWGWEREAETRTLFSFRGSCWALFDFFDGLVLIYLVKKSKTLQDSS